MGNSQSDDDDLIGKRDLKKFVNSANTLPGRPSQLRTKISSDSFHMVLDHQTTNNTDELMDMSVEIDSKKSQDIKQVLELKDGVNMLLGSNLFKSYIGSVIEPSDCDGIRLTKSDSLLNIEKNISVFEIIEKGEEDILGIYSQKLRMRMCAKKLRSDPDSLDAIENKELEAYKLIKESNDEVLLKVYDIISNENGIMIQYEFSRVSLRDYFDFRKKASIPWDKLEILLIFDNIFDQMARLARLGIYLYDLNLENILLNSTGKIFKIRSFKNSYFKDENYIEFLKSKSNFLPENYKNEFELPEHDPLVSQLYILGKFMLKLLRFQDVEEEDKKEDEFFIKVFQKDYPEFYEKFLEKVIGDYDSRKLILSKFEFSKIKYAIPVNGYQLIDFKTFIQRKMKKNNSQFYLDINYNDLIMKMLLEEAEIIIREQLKDTKRNKNEKTEIVLGINYDLIDCLYIQKNYNSCIKELKNLEAIRQADKIALIKSKINYVYGKIYLDQGNYNDAQSKFDNAIKSLEGESSETLALKSKILSSIGNLNDTLGFFEKANGNYKESLEIVQKIFPSEGLEIAEAYHNIGLNLIRQIKLNEALFYVSKSLQIRIKIFGEENIKVADTYDAIGLLYKLHGHFRESFYLIEKGHKIRLSILGEDHPDSYASAPYLAQVLLCLGRNKEALQYLLKYLTLKSKFFGENVAEVADCYANMSDIRKVIKDRAGAIDDQLKALKIRKKIFGDQNLFVANSYQSLGNILRVSKKPDEAMDSYYNALKIKSDLLGENHPDIAGLCNNLGNMYRTMGMISAAKKYYQSAIDIFLKYFSEDHINVQSVRLNLKTLEDSRKEQIMYYF